LFVNYVFVLAIGIGIVAGLRSLMAPAVVAWAAHLGWLNLHGSPLAFIGSTTAVAVFSLLAIGELVADKLPNTPKRTAIVPLVARIAVGGLWPFFLFRADAEFSWSELDYLHTSAATGDRNLVRPFL
jgi:uncharacterized membrane protein